jgi:hypothetical protein
MPDNGLTEVAYSSGEVMYTCLAGKVWTWTLMTGREFSWSDGVLSIWNGRRYVPLVRTPSWQAGIQWSCGFEAGRSLLPFGKEGS